MPTAIFSKDFLDEYKSGKRFFPGIILQYADFAGQKFQDLIIKDSKLFFVRFRNCDLKNVKFLNCEIIYPSFEGAIENTEFDNCTVDLALFENTRFKRTKIARSMLIWSFFFNCTMGEVDMSTSSLSKVFTDTSQITPQDVEDGMAHLGPIVDSLDISIRAKVRENLQKEAERYNIDIKVAGGDRDYSAQQSGYKGASGTGYGAGMQDLLDSVINAYNAANTYRTKKGYKTENKYE